jgi:hypothetical protein
MVSDFGVVSPRDENDSIRPLFRFGSSPDQKDGLGNGTGRFSLGGQE